VASGLVSDSGGHHLDIGEIMSIDIYFSDDIRNALLAAAEASSSTVRACAAAGGDHVTLLAYIAGYRAALIAVALAFGLAPQHIMDDEGARYSVVLK